MAKNYRVALEVEKRNNQAGTAEQDGDFATAVKLYERNIREDHADKFAFDRLMIIYRRQKEYKNELRVINRGIKVFQQNLEAHIKNSLIRRVDGKKLARLSNAILKNPGLKKDQFHFPDPIDKWIKRKKTVEDKLEK